MIDPGENLLFSLLRGKRSIYPDEYVGVFLYFCGIFPQHINLNGIFSFMHKLSTAFPRFSSLWITLRSSYNGVSKNYEQPTKSRRLEFN
jgi:hypothetical protein